MKANELRIGNFVNRMGVITHINGINKGVNHYTIRTPRFRLITTEQIDPIPLTEEWLKRFGFEVRESSTAKEFYIGENEITHDWLFSVVWLEKPELIKAPNAPFYRNGRHTIYYVHQLQNLFFALTGEELTLND
jgi:hypothetical protein